jgi:hypothetical protein
MNASAATTRLQLDPTRLASLCTSHRVSRLWLFGSILRPNFRPESDIDVLVEFAPGAQIGAFLPSRVFSASFRSSSLVTSTSSRCEASSLPFATRSS